MTFCLPFAIKSRISFWGRESHPFNIDLKVFQRGSNRMALMFPKFLCLYIRCAKVCYVWLLYFGPGFRSLFFRVFRKMLIRSPLHAHPAHFLKLRIYSFPFFSLWPPYIAEWLIIWRGKWVWSKYYPKQRNVLKISV